MKLITLTACGGAGKDSILNALVRYHGELKTIVSYTSRPMRYGEQEGVEYYFKTYDEMNRLINNKGLLEHRIYTVRNGDIWIYGIPMDAIDWFSNNIYIVIVDYDGLKQIRKVLKGKGMLNDLYSFYISVSDQTRFTRTFNRDNNKKMTDEEFNKFINEINRRFEADTKEVLPAKYDKDIIVVNNDDRPLINTIKEIEERLESWNLL